MKIYYKYLFFFSLAVLLSFFSQAQDLQEVNQKKPVFQHSNAGKRADTVLRIMFYNVENLFDPRDDSITSDEEYQPTGKRGWTSSRLKRKQIKISKVVSALCGREHTDT